MRMLKVALLLTLVLSGCGGMRRITVNPPMVHAPRPLHIPARH